MTPEFTVPLWNGAENWRFRFDLDDPKDAARIDFTNKIVHMTRGRKVETLENDGLHEVSHIELPELSEKKTKRLERGHREFKKALIKFLSENPRFAK